MKMDVKDNFLIVQPTDKKETNLLRKVADFVPFQEGWTIPCKYIYQLRELLKSIKIWERTDAFNKFIKELKPQQTVEIKCGVINSYIDFKGLDGKSPIYSEAKKNIDKACSYFMLGAQNSSMYKRGLWDGIVRLYNSRYNSVPTGLLYLVEEELNRKHIKYVKYNTFNDSPKPEFNWKVNKVIIPDKSQLQAVEAGLKYKRGVIKSPTGFGKTSVVSVRLTASFAVPTLFVANKKTLLDDAKDSFVNLIDGLEESEVDEIKDGTFGKIKIKKDTQESDIPALDSHIVVATIQSLHSRLNDPRTSKNLKKWLSKICKLVIIDECQSINDKQWKEVLNECKAPYRIALSATPQ